MPLRTYNAAEVTMILGGVIVDGLADGTFLEIDQNEDAFSLQVGSAGEACRSKSNNKSGRVTFTLLQSSLANDLLSALHLADLATPNGDSIVPMLVKDLSGRTICAAEKAWITRMPTSAFGREAESREWVAETDNLVQFHGGN